MITKSKSTFISENNCEPNDQKKDVETRMGADGTTEIILTPARAEAKEFKDIEFKDPLKKPLALDEGKWAVFCWLVSKKCIHYSLL